MPKSRAPVHYLHTDGTILCRGLEALQAGRALDDDPYRVAWQIELVTCDVCRRAHARQARENAMAS
jgi:hypothetical protein